MAVTFKKHKKEIGLASIGYPYQSVDIKFKKKVFGTIYAPNWKTKDNLWTVGIMVNDSDSQSDWRWVFFKQKHDDENSARQWIVENFENINNKYNLRFSEE